MKSITRILVAAGMAAALLSKPVLAGDGKTTLHEKIVVEQEDTQMVGGLAQHGLGQPLHVPRRERVAL